MTKAINAGSDVDTYCNKCKLVLNHVVIAMKDGKPARVLCRTCNTEHAFKAAPAGGKATGRGAEPQSSAAEFERLLAGRDVGTATPYSMQGHFRAAQIIKHVRFGVGVVVRDAGQMTIEVLFRDGMKKLAHDR